MKKINCSQASEYDLSKIMKCPECDDYIRLEWGEFGQAIIGCDKCRWHIFKPNPISINLEEKQKEIERMKTKIGVMKKKNDLLEKCRAYYGEKGNWHESNYLGRGSAICYEDEDYDDDEDVSHGGKLARQTKLEIENIDKQLEEQG